MISCKLVSHRTGSPNNITAETEKNNKHCKQVKLYPAVITGQVNIVLIYIETKQKA